MGPQNHDHTVMKRVVPFVASAATATILWGCGPQAGVQVMVVPAEGEGEGEGGGEGEGEGEGTCEGEEILELE